MLGFLIFFNLCMATCFTATLADEDWILTFNSSNINQLEMGNSVQLMFSAQTNTSWYNENLKVQVVISDVNVAYANQQLFDLPLSNDLPVFKKQFVFNLTSEFVGYAELNLRIVELENNTIVAVKSSNNKHIKIVVVRKPQLIDKIFVICVAGLMSIIFINLGCALDLKQLKQCIRKPIAPAASFFAQFFILPIFSFFYAKLIFPNSVPMQLGVFFTGISPGGGASSVWALLLGGNINLSIVLTTLGTLESFIMIPFWVVFLGNQIFSMGELPVPYSRIATSIVALIIPLCIGYCIQYFLPRLCKVMVRVLKPLSSCLIIFIIVFATVTNLYLFQIFSWEVILAGAAIPWTGYLVGLIVSITTRLSNPDIISMAVESGIQNTGITIFMLKFCLGQPAADITTIIPVAVALMTPIPLMIGVIIKCFRKKEEIVENSDPAAESILKNNESVVTATSPGFVDEVERP